ncbi:MAG: diguanylate cyclase domain-containing protein [Pararhizobium sp.]
MSGRSGAILAGEGTAAVIARLQAQLDAQAAIIREQAAALAHSKKIFDRSSVAASIGVWECSLPDEKLRWTDVVYDIFELPRGSALDRTATVRMYTRHSAEELHERRSRAIAECAGFGMDAEIITARGNRRWIRITATVDCEGDRPIGIFGMKQDITEEKILLDRTRYLADFDPMTGLANRSQFQALIAALSEGNDGEGTLGALLLVDLDGFKAINDSCGHAVGDVCLKAAAVRLRLACPEAALVARIGGDEFAVLVAKGHDRAVVAGMARRIVEALAKPVEHHGRGLVFGASVGIAFAGAGGADALFTRADAALYAAKAAGRGTFRMCKTSPTFRPDDSCAA